MIVTAKLEQELEIVRRHVQILKEVMKNQPIGIIKLSQILDVPEHKVRYSLRVLEQEKLIEPTPEGAKVAKKVKKELESLKKSLEGIIEKAEGILNDIEEMEKM